MNFKTGDKVVVISGKDKGKEGKITHVLRAENRVVVEGVNIVKKHVKGNGQTAGSINEVEAPIHASNVMIIDPETGEETVTNLGLRSVVSGMNTRLFNLEKSFDDLETLVNKHDQLLTWNMINS